MVQWELLLLLLSCFSRVQLCDPIDGSPRDSSVPGVLQARTLVWVAISFSTAWKWKVKVKSLSRVRPSATPWTAAYQAPPPMEWGAITNVQINQGVQLCFLIQHKQHVWLLASKTVFASRWVWNQKIQPSQRVGGGRMYYFQEVRRTRGIFP